jgi:superfamily II DNA or RNA helicase
MKITPRPYQIEARRCVLDQWKEVTSTLVCKPVGTGKTILFALIIEAMRPQRAIVIAERTELIWQARDKIQRTTGLECGIEMGELSVNNDSLFGAMPVVISTIQTQCSAMGDRRRMSRFNPKDFGVMVIDECHHSTSRSYRDLINYYKSNNPDIRIVGVTATPDRADEEALGQVFETVAFDYEILDAIHDGWLVPVEQQFVSVGGLDFSQMRTTAGDLNGADLAQIMESERNMQGVASPSIEIIGDKRALAFTASVKQAETLSNIFNRHKPGCSEWVCGATNKDVRKEMLARFQGGEIQIMVNCNCLAEGFDDPGVEVILQARPTKSRSLYAQQIGRAMRPLPGIVDGPETPDLRKSAIAGSKKPSCLIVDFVGNSGRHKLMTSADILGGKVSDEAIERAIIKAKKDGGAVRMSDALDQADEEIRQEAEERRRAEEARKARLVAKVNYSARSVSPFDMLQIAPVKTRGWDNGRTLSEKQKAYLLRQGVNPDTIPYAQGRQLLTAMFKRMDAKLASLKQLKVLARYGYTDATMPYDQASKILDSLARNGWRKP